MVQLQDDLANNYFGFDMGQKWEMISERNTDTVYIFMLDVFFKIYFTFSGRNSSGYWLGVECTQICIESTEASSSEQTIFTGRHTHLILAFESGFPRRTACRESSYLLQCPMRPSPHCIASAYRTFAGNFLCGLACSAALTRC